MTTNKTLIGSAALVLMAAAMCASYYFGKHNEGAAFADVPETPQLVASEAGAPAVPGLCVLSQSAVYANAKVGQVATARYRQLAAELRAQISPEQQAIQADAKKLEATHTTMSAAELQQQEQALAQRFQALRAADALDSRELEATRQKALRQIAALASPVITDAYKTHHCGALFSRDMMLAGNPGMDLTAVVVQGLDAKVTTLAFDLEHLPVMPGAQR